MAKYEVMLLALALAVCAFISTADGMAYGFRRGSIRPFTYYKRGNMRQGPCIRKCNENNGQRKLLVNCLHCWYFPKGRNQGTTSNCNRTELYNKCRFQSPIMGTADCFTNDCVGEGEITGRLTPWKPVTKCVHVSGPRCRGSGMMEFKRECLPGPKSGPNFKCPSRWYVNGPRLTRKLPCATSCGKEEGYNHYKRSLGDDIDMDSDADDDDEDDDNDD